MSAATSISLPSRESVLEARERVARWLETNAAGGRLVLSCGRVVVTPTVARGPRGMPVAGVGAKKAISNLALGAPDGPHVTFTLHLPEATVS